MNFLYRIDDKDCLREILTAPIPNPSFFLPQRLKNRLLTHKINCVWKAIILPLEAVATIKGLGKNSIDEFRYQFRHLDDFPATDKVKGELMDLFERTREHLWDWSKQRSGVSEITSENKLQFVSDWCTWEDFERAMDKALIQGKKSLTRSED